MRFMLGVIVLVLILGSINMLLTHQLPGIPGGEPIDAPLFVVLMTVGFLLYGAYILWDELL